MALGEITRGKALQFKGILTTTKNANVAAQYTRNVGAVYGKILKNWNIPDRDKPFNIEKKIERLSKKKELLPSEYRELYDAMKASPPESEKFEVLRRFIFMCGGIRFSDTNLIEKEKHYFEFQENGEVLRGISKPAQKSGEVGIIPILPQDAEWLLRWRPSGLLFDPVDYNQYLLRLKQISRSIIGREISTHYGRHFAGDSIVNQEGLGMDDVQAILGISNAEIAKIYAQKDIKKVISKYYKSVAQKATGYTKKP